MSPMRGQLYVISAPSGGGKTSLTRALLPRLAAVGIAARISVSYTTRAPRPGETDGVHYHFVSPQRFDELLAEDAFLEHAEVFDRRYGTGRAATEALLAQGIDVLLDIDWQGARQVRAAAPDATGIFILPPSTAALRERLRSRAQDDAATIERRMALARSEMAHHDEYDYLLVNDDFEYALSELLAVFQARRLERPLALARHRALIAALLDSAA